MTEEALDYLERDRLRERLLTLVHEGLLDRFEAEEKAASVGVVLNPSDDPAHYDPSGLKDWSMPMALAWATFRSMPPVRSVWPHFKNSQFEWEPVLLPPQTVPRPMPTPAPEGVTPIGRLPIPLPPKQGWRYRRMAAPTVGEMLRVGSPWRDEFKDGPFKHSRGTHGSYRDLLMALASGRVPSKGADLRTGTHPSPKPMAAEEWNFLDHIDNGGQDAWGKRGVPIFVDLLIDRAALIEYFPSVAIDDGEQDARPKAIPDRTPKKFTSADLVNYRAMVVAAIVANPHSPPSGGGWAHYVRALAGRGHLPRDIAAAEYKAALIEALTDAPDHTWGKIGRPGKESGASGE